MKRRKNPVAGFAMQPVRVGSVVPDTEPCPYCDDGNHKNNHCVHCHGQGQRLVQLEER